MPYTLVDLLEKLRDIELYSAKMYEDIAANCSDKDQRVNLVAKVLRSEEMRHVERYMELIEDSGKQEDIDIDFEIYDKAYSLMNEFKKRIYIPQISSVSDLLSFAYEFEKATTALLLDIRGRMVRDSSDIANYNYIAMTEMIFEEQKHADAIAKFIK